MVTVAICDDDRACLAAARQMVDEFATLNPGFPILVKEFSDGRSLVNAVLIDGGFDIYLLDVIMPGISGIEAGRDIRKYDDNGLIIYLTSSPDFGVDSYTARAFHYLLKPPVKKEFFDVFGRAVSEISKRKERSISVKTSDGTVIVRFDDVVYVTLEKRALCYHTQDGKRIYSVSQREAFSDCISPLFSDTRFALCGPGTCVNLFYIKAVDNDSAEFKSGEKLYLSKKACKDLRRSWLDYWLVEEI